MRNENQSVLKITIRTSNSECQMLQSQFLAYIHVQNTFSLNWFIFERFMLFDFFWVLNDVFIVELICFLGYNDN